MGLCEHDSLVQVYKTSIYEYVCGFMWYAINEILTNLSKLGLRTSFDKESPNCLNLSCCIWVNCLFSRVGAHYQLF